MSLREVETLQERSRVFLRHAQEALKKGEFDFTAFATEQAAQLLLKASLLESVGEVPRSHSVRELLGIIADSSPEKAGKVKAFLKENRDGLKILDDAYISARYLPSSYSGEDAELLIRLTKDINKVIGRKARG